MINPAVLFVDDEPGVLRALKRLFRKASFTVLTASGGLEGLALLEQHTVNVVVSDQRMPRMCGTDFLKEVRLRHPHTVRCVLSGYAEMESVVAAINDGNVYRFISKPWNELTITETVNECLSLSRELIEQSCTRISINERAIALEEQSVQFAELLKLQKSLLKSARHVLDSLPVSIAVLDAIGRMIYTNRQFTREFGHLPGTVLGQLAGEPWLSAVNDITVGEIQLHIDENDLNAQVGKIDIGGQQHSLIAMSPNHN